ncbi:MAG: exodeoxyribonuclease VII large subunit [Candidatus Dormibacteraeota bacterium]|nr:exodeoxyribonuclease VII large subunit [Candidatus Dormibacteraeota bacterium]
MSGAAVYTVTELTTLVVTALAERPELEDVLVEGEISNLTRPSSGHIYLTLKDGSSALSCVCFRANALRIPFAPANGMTVVAHGQVSVYAQQGRYQLLVDRLEPSGVGALALAVEQRKRALSAEGLFDQQHKRPLPLLPARVAVVTSRTGAALHDVVTVLGRRAPCVDVVFSSATVQGDGAAETIVAALRRAGRARGVEVVLLVRGGGALEDLMAFNDDAVARAIRACPVPVVSGVGHETDITIADLAADHRAATPSAAAETVAPSCGQLRGELDARERRLRDSLRREVAHKRERAQRRFSRLDSLSPVLRVARMRQDVHTRDVRLRGALVTGVSRRQRDLERVRGTLALHSPVRALPVHRERLAARSARLEGGVRAALVTRRRHLEGVNGRLEALSPLRVIDRGYSITVDTATGRLVTTATAVRPGSVLRTRLARGTVMSEVLPDEVAAERERMYDGGPAQTVTSEDDHG